MTVFDDIRADREAGTPGGWEISTDVCGYETCTIHGIEKLPTEDGLGQGWCYIKGPRAINDEWYWPDEAAQSANARRIARVPELEAIALAAEKMAEALEKIASDNVPVEDWNDRNKCKHGRHADEDCKFCTMKFASAALAELRGVQGDA